MRLCDHVNDSPECEGERNCYVDHVDIYKNFKCGGNIAKINSSAMITFESQLFACRDNTELDEILTGEI